MACLPAAEEVLDAAHSYVGIKVHLCVSALPDGMAIADLQQLLTSDPAGGWHSLLTVCRSDSTLRCSWPSC